MDSPAPFHVLLVEDSPDDRADIRQMLLRGSPRRYKFTEAETGSAALRALRETATLPDCILLDFNLPDMTALDILAEWQAGTPLPGCPVVVLTGVAECGAHVIGAGAQDFVGKSWASPESLTRAIENAVERYAVTRERQKAYEALCASEQRLDLGLRVAGVALAEVDYRTGLNHLSAESARQFGLGASAVALPRERVHATFHPDDRAKLVTRIDESLDPAGAGWFAMDHRVIWPSGEVRWLRVRKQVFFAGEGRARRPVRAVLATFDITTEKGAEERLRLFEKVVTGISDAVIITETEPIDVSGPRIVYVNPALTAMTGFTPAEAIGRSPRLLQGPKSSRAALKKIRTALEKLQPVTVEVTNYRKDGTEFDVELSIAPVANEQGRFTHWVSLQRDVSARNRAAAALVQNVALFAKIIEQAPGGVYVLDAQLRVRVVNTEALEVFATMQPVIGRELGEMLVTLWGPEIGRECTAIVRRTLETGERYVSPRFDYRRQDIGVKRAYEWETQRLTLPDGQHGVVCYFQDVTSKERAAAALRLSEERLRLAQDAAHIGSFDWNIRTGVNVWSPELESMYGLPIGGFAQTQADWVSLVHPEDRAEAVRLVERALATGEPVEGEWRAVWPDESVHWLLSRFQVFKDAAGAPMRMAGVNLDITGRKHDENQVRLLNRDLEQRVSDRVVELATKARLLTERNAEIELARITLEEKAAELARASGYKSEFLANMSHELRTPLNIILLLSQQLAANKPGNLSAKQREFAHLVHSSGSDLLNLINDILDLAKIESGTVTLKVEEVSLARLCDSLTRHFQPVADAKKLKLQANLAEGLPASLHSDTQRVRQILKNLVANALKFTARGHVGLRVGPATQGWQSKHPILSQAAQVIAFAVEDTGIGITPAQQRRIFESFQQADATTSRHHGGTGLGLAISRELAALLGGAITLTSAPGRGSTFTLYLPQKFIGHYHPVQAGQAGDAGDRKVIIEILPQFEPLAEDPDYARQGSASAFPTEAPAGKLRPEVSREIFRGRKVLVVDDDVRNIFALTALLENHDLETVSATDGRSAIRLLQTTPDVSLVLMDIMMPEMDGYETMRELRQSAQFRTLPIVALTAHAMNGDREKCLAAGANDYLAKPVNSEQLLAVMSDWMAR